MNLYPGAKIHIWCDGSATLMQVTNGPNNDPFEFTESLTLLSDPKIGATCDLYINVKDQNEY